MDSYYDYDLANDISWSFGSCDSDYAFFDDNGDYNEDLYLNNRTYNQTCCFNTSPNNWVFPLVCKGEFGYGWDDGYITIEGQRYCGDFSFGREKTVYVEANPS